MNKQNWIEAIIGVLALVSILIIALQSLVSLSREWLWGLYMFDLAICLFFACDFVFRISRAQDKITFLKFHGYEIIAMVPAVVFYAIGTTPAISGALRSLRLVRVLRIVFVLARYARLFQSLGRFIQRSGIIWLSAATISIIFLGGFIVFVLETGTVEAQINNFSDAIWWSISTITTVGYGDIVPHTSAGRIIGMVLMIIGIGVMTVFISQISATLVESRVQSLNQKANLTNSLIIEIKSHIDNIENLTDSELSLLLNMIHELHKAKKL